MKKFIVTILTLILVFPTVALMGCGATSGSVNPNNEDNGEKSSTSIYNDALLTVGEITVYDKSGSAVSLGTTFCIDSTGKFLTNYHVIDDAYSAKIELNGKTYEVKKVLAYDEDIDLAILKIDGSFKKVNLYRGSVTGGAKVYAVGSSEGLTLSFSNGVISSSSRIMDSVEYIQHTAPISHGNSGGPLFDAYGNVIGVNTSSLTEGQNLNFAIKINEMDNLKVNETTLQALYNKKHSGVHSSTCYEVGEYILEEVEPNGTYSLADKVTVNGTTVSGTIKGASDADVFKFELGAGETVDIIGKFNYDSDTRGSVSAIFDSNENAVEVTDYDSSDKILTIIYTNPSSYTRTFYFVVLFKKDYIYRNTDGPYLFHFFFY